jgi:hypothetical protein
MKAYGGVEAHLHTLLTLEMDVSASHPQGKGHWYPLDWMRGEFQNQSGCFVKETDLKIKSFGGVTPCWLVNMAML